MAEEIMEAVQIIRVAYEGIEIAMKIGSGGLSAAQRTVETLIGLFEYEKTAHEGRRFAGISVPDGGHEEGGEVTEKVWHSLFSSSGY